MCGGWSRAFDPFHPPPRAGASHPTRIGRAAVSQLKSRRHGRGGAYLGVWQRGGARGTGNTGGGPRRAPPPAVSKRRTTRSPGPYAAHGGGVVCGQGPSADSARSASSASSATSCVQDGTKDIRGRWRDESWPPAALSTDELVISTCVPWAGSGTGLGCPSRRCRREGDMGVIGPRDPSLMGDSNEGGLADLPAGSGGGRWMPPLQQEKARECEQNGRGWREERAARVPAAKPSHTRSRCAHPPPPFSPFHCYPLRLGHGTTSLPPSPVGHHHLFTAGEIVRHRVELDSPTATATLRNGDGARFAHR